MRISDWSSDVCSSDLPARPRAWRDGAARSFRCLPRADGGDQGRIFSGRIVAEEVERAAMIFASFGAASGDMPPRIFVAGEYLVGIDALKLKGVGAADYAQGETIGRAPRRERVCQYGETSRVPGHLKKKVTNDIIFNQI